MCDRHTASLRRRPERDYLREKGRSARRERRAIGELPDTGKNRRSGVGQEMAHGRGSNRFVKQRAEEKSKEEGWRRNGRLSVLRLVELDLERASVRVAPPVLRGRFLRVVSAGEEREAGDLFELAVIACRRPDEREQENQNCFREPHT